MSFLKFLVYLLVLIIFGLFVAIFIVGGARDYRQLEEIFTNSDYFTVALLMTIHIWGSIIGIGFIILVGIKIIDNKKNNLIK